MELLDGRARIARGDQDLVDARGLREFPGQRVLAAAAADHEDLQHLSGGSGACR